jgi:[ribosomal protein S18]-alanine N-acetyltransferase
MSWFRQPKARRRTETEVRVRWATPDDAAAMLRASSDSTAEELARWATHPNVVFLVAESGRGVVGMAVFRFRRDYLQIERLAVLATARRRGVGTAIIKSLARRLNVDTAGRTTATRIVLAIDERNLPAQLFLRARGFRADATLSGAFSETGEDVYRFTATAQSLFFPDQEAF